MDQFNIKTLSHQYRDSHYPSCLYNGIPIQYMILIRQYFYIESTPMLWPCPSLVMNFQIHDFKKNISVTRICSSLSNRWEISIGLEARLGNSVTGFMISDESGNRFFPTAVTDYWQDKAACRHENQRKRQISGLSSMSMVAIVRYLSSGPQLLYTMPWGLQILKDMMNYTRCEGSYPNDE